MLTWMVLYFFPNMLIAINLHRKGESCVTIEMKRNILSLAIYCWYSCLFPILSSKFLWGACLDSLYTTLRTRITCLQAQGF